jgi:phosphoribosylglycinamide formyltransferase-1
MAGIPAVCRSPKSFASSEEFNEEFLRVLQSAEPDLVVLAGCLVVIPEAVVRAFPNRIINIHPSLIPSFCGKGFYGLHVHEKVLERGVRVTGATVHFVDEGTDTGPVILQKPVMVEQGDTPEILQKRVMEQAEWKILPMAVDLIAQGRVRVEGHHVLIEDYDSSALA